MGGLKKVPSEGGSGGKRGHSNMEHWAFTAEIKGAARVRRRADDREQSPRASGMRIDLAALDQMESGEISGDERACAV